MLSNLMLLFISILVSSFVFTTHSYNNKCLLHQETLLLQLRDELIFDSSLSTKLVRWNESGDCCNWHGVECDASGHVVSLKLDEEGISGGIGDLSSLFKFKYLQKLNLARNFFYHTGLVIPKGIGNFIYLTHLNLSNAGFGGQVPSEISSLTRLTSLDITSSSSLSLDHPNLEMLVQNLTELRELYLDWVDITSLHERKNWGHILSSHLPNLTSLSMANCNLCGPFPKSSWQLHSLSVLQLDYNNLSAVSLHDMFTKFPSLTTLTLSECSLKGSIPSTFANLTELIHVDLSENSLTGSLPSTLFANLTKLIHVDFSHNSLTGSLSPTIFEGVSNLVHLDVSFNSFSGNIPKSLFSLPSLLELDLGYNQFNGTFQLDNLQSLPNLTFLSLSANSLSVFLIQSPYGGLKLKVLRLKSCNLSSFPDFNKHLDLEALDLSKNCIAGEIPSWIWGTQLEYLDLSFNLLTNLQKPFHIPPSLVTLHLQSNQLRGELHLSIPLESQLWSLSLANNSLSGSLPTSICNAIQLISLSLSGNILSGSIPTCLGNATQLSFLDLSGNKLIGSIPTSICNATQLFSLSLSGNKLSGSIPTCLFNATQLETLSLSENKLSGSIPTGLYHATQLYDLFLSGNKLSGSIPTWLCNATQLNRLRLSGNKLSGSIPDCLLINILEIDLSRNNLSGSIPPFPLGKIRFLDLSQNKINGRIPDIFPMNCELQYLDLNNNTLEGKIPKSIEHCKGLEYMNVGNNMMHDTFPCMLSSELVALVLHSNRFHGDLRCHTSWPSLKILDISSNHFSGSLESVNFSSWTAMMLPSDGNLRVYGYEFDVILIMKGKILEFNYIQIDFSTIDLSSNSFYGKIPNAIGDLTSLHQINFSHNALNGSIPKSFGRLKNLESLDLSMNQLAGLIPEELGGLTFLAVLNLSYNKFVGPIPKGRQIQTFSADSFEGNPGLCGFPLDISCGNNTNVSLPSGYDENGEEKTEIEWEYVCVAVGYVVGVGSIGWLLLFCRSFKEKYFGKIEEVVEDMFIARDMRRRRARRAAAAKNRVRRQ